ncbi:GntR family transcriptional regulator [Paenibacillus macerans]|uniref:Periplasmic binding s and sugar binding domain of LacI family protein n=1 Tax=Paenibacillus macerans TaxID=44252 RepID=A0A090ZJ77_PAEMA|nr:GntR family transcriptional regulator [Paenibacillus macerans]KFN10315.1 periplasmic binding s and sugar binding domain of LacI family protein [Paenibacillus macerans]MCY7561955.1 GntR family transcriptional regulator [Paenibacillus macerans]MEC0149556.1 GntR family transcriptional regulator [Paenibacillus macerans]SUD26172.1 GntR family transcriptional regulator [Paenibacillus macerans]
MQNERKPLYMQIQEHFKNQILRGELRENEKIPSEKELMEQFDVSRITVANALTQLAKDGWIYRIPGRGSFVGENIKELMGGSHVHESGSGMRTENGGGSVGGTSGTSGTSGMGGAANTSPVTAAAATGADKMPYPPDTAPPGGEGRKTIGLVMPLLVDYFGIRLIQGINNVIENSGYSLHIVLTYNSIEREKEAIQDLLRKGAAGLIIFPCDAETYNEEILALKLSGFPFVLLDRYLPGIATNVARSDGLIGGQLAVDYLWSLGHRDIAICSDSPLPTITVEDRINGYMEALKQKEAMINPALILTDFNVDYSGIDKTHPLYRFIKNRIATAYITLNGRLGLHIYSICKELGLQVPEDVSILTFDDPSPGLHEWGYFSHISQSEVDMGEAAANILLQIFENSDNKEPGYAKVILQPKLIESQSTGPLIHEKR